MATEHTIKTFTAFDIEKYQHGLLSPKERHDLEKAALDDPFLADALEGYHSSPVNISADLTELKNRLAEKTEEKKNNPFTYYCWQKSIPLVEGCRHDRCSGRCWFIGLSICIQ